MRPVPNMRLRGRRAAYVSTGAGLRNYEALMTHAQQHWWREPSGLFAPFPEPRRLKTPRSRCSVADAAVTSAAFDALVAGPESCTRPAGGSAESTDSKTAVDSYLWLRLRDPERLSTMLWLRDARAPAFVKLRSYPADFRFVRLAIGNCR